MRLFMGREEKREKKSKNWGMGPPVFRGQEEEAESTENWEGAVKTGEKPEGYGIMEAKCRKR